MKSDLPKNQLDLNILRRGHGNLKRGGGENGESAQYTIFPS